VLGSDVTNSVFWRKWNTNLGETRPPWGEGGEREQGNLAENPAREVTGLLRYQENFNEVGRSSRKDDIIPGRPAGLEKAERLSKSQTTCVVKRAHSQSVRSKFGLLIKGMAVKQIR